MSLSIKQRTHRLRIETLRARIEMDQLRLKELESAEVGIASENDAKGYETAKQEMAKEQALNPLDQAKLELINAKIAVEKAKLERLKKAPNPLILPSEAVEAGI